jgi:hypothetical protein
VPRRHQQHQPIDLATLHALELLGDLPVQVGGLVPRIRELGEANY